VPELRLEESVVDERYKLARCMNRGSYAEIFLARDPERGDKEVIIKALNPFLQGTPDPLLEKTLIENFQNEAIALDKVRHPNIIQRLGHGTASDLEGTVFHYLVLEYMSGGDMLKLCRNRPIPIGESLFYFEQVSDGLAFAHSRSVIHRDIKPNNLLLSGDRRTVKIADFGVAKIASDDSAEITRVGTNIYAPPEHHPDNETAVLQQALTPSADIYSLAKTIYTAIVGTAPHQFARCAITALPDEVSNEPWADALLSILQKATADKSAERYQTVPEFWQAFAAVKSHLARASDTDEEATLVKPRNQPGVGGAVPIPIGPGCAGSAYAGNDHASAMSQPNFQPTSQAAVYSSAARPLEDKIVVELTPRRPSPPEAIAKQGLDGKDAKPAQSQAAAAHDDGAGNFKTQPIGSESARSVFLAENQAGAPAVRPGKSAGQSPKLSAEEYGVFDAQPSVKWTEWLRRSFIVFLVVALIGLVASTYRFFSAHTPIPGLGIGGSNEDGSIVGAPNVNIRSEPGGGGVLAWLPSGSRVRILETRGAWVRIKVLEWSGTRPLEAPETGWIGSHFVKLDKDK
jgi:serine/threonine protein kinase